MDAHMVPPEGLEPPRPRGHQDLNLACLPIPPRRLAGVHATSSGIAWHSHRRMRVAPAGMQAVRPDPGIAAAYVSCTLMSGKLLFLSRRWRDSRAAVARAMSK